MEKKQVNSLPHVCSIPLFQEDMKEKAKVEEEKKDEEKEDPMGVPDFWLTVFKNVDLLSDMLQVLSANRGGGMFSLMLHRAFLAWHSGNLAAASP